MALVIATPECVLRKEEQFHEEQKHDLINVFLRMWDGKVNFIDKVVIGDGSYVSLTAVLIHTLDSLLYG